MGRKISKRRREALRDVQGGNGKGRWLRWRANKRKGKWMENRWPEWLLKPCERSSVYGRSLG